MYGAGDKSMPQVMEVPEGTDLTLYEYMYFTINACKVQANTRFLVRLFELIGTDLLYEERWLSQSFRKKFDKEMKKKRAAQQEEKTGEGATSRVEGAPADNYQDEL